MPTGFITHTFCSKHLTGKDSPESPVRTSAVEEQLMASGLGYAFERIEDTYQASEADILRAHDPDYLQRIKDVIPKKLGETAQICADTILSHHSLEAALSSAGCVIDATKRVLSKQLGNAFCCVRPPGHHAGRHGGSGFCIFNNIHKSIFGILSATPVGCKCSTSVFIYDICSLRIKPPNFVSC